jgi:hypothetical protein
LRAVAAISAAIVLCVGAGRLPAQDKVFQFDGPVDLGTNLSRIGSVRWDHVLGTEWDTGFSFGGMVGKRNATVIPEVRDPVFGNVLVERVTADTRTGGRMRGDIFGSTGLEFKAEFDASGLEQGAAFDFRPRIIDLPTQVRSGEFVKLQTHAGVMSNPAFTEALVDLPSFEAGMNFFFNMEIDADIEYGLFPFVPYNKVSLAPDPIRVEQPLLSFDFDLDPKSNGGQGLPPTFTMFEGTPFEGRLGLLDNDEYLASKQFSVDMSVEGESVKRQLDIGSAELVNPFGTGDSILGPDERNLTISTAVTGKSVQYSFDTPLVRLGLDLDGIAAYLGSAALTGAGHSFTRLEQSFLNDQIEVTMDMIDVKYGPEIGYREKLDIKPDFEVTLDFGGQTVALNDGEQITLAKTYTGLWNDLPEIALLGDTPVNVDVSFGRLTGEQTKRGVMYLTDYLELTLLELEELKLARIIHRVPA